MTRHHDHLRELVLVYEELEPEEKSMADAHLGECADCASLLAKLQRLEQTSDLRGAVPELGRVRLATAERAQAEASLVALRARVGHPATGVAGPAPRPAAPKSRPVVSSVWEWARRAPLLVRLAPALAVLLVAWILWPRQPVAPLLRGAELERYSGMRGAVGDGFKTGEAFVLKLELAAPARPVVYHVDPEGRIDLLYPKGADAVRPLMPAGRVTLPAETSGIEWRFEGAPGTETFLVAATRRTDLPMARRESLRTPASGSREARIRALASSIEKEIGPARRLDAIHTP
jgi:hypothetical protein